MSKTIKIFLLISLVLFFQVGIFPHIAILGVYPNLILILIISLSILKGFKESLLWTIIAGLFLDFYSLSNLLGISVICLLIVSFVAFFLARNIFKKTNPSSVASVFFLTIILYNILLLVSYKIIGNDFEIVFLKILINVLYSSIISVPVFYMIKKLFPVIKP